MEIDFNKDYKLQKTGTNHEVMVPGHLVDQTIAKGFEVIEGPFDKGSNELNLQDMITSISDESGEGKSTEEIQDIIGAMFQSATHTNVTVTYDDAAGTISLSASGSGGGASLSQEEIEDIVGGVATQGTGISVSYDDINNALVLSLSGESFTTALKNKLDAIAAGATANDTDANLKNRANHTGSQAISTVSGLQTALDSKAGMEDIFSGNYEDLSNKPSQSTSGGGAVSLPMKELMLGRGNTATTGLFAKKNNLFSFNGKTLRRFTRFSEGADYFPNSGNQTGSNYKTIAPNASIISSTVYSMCDSGKDDDVMYVMGTNNFGQLRLCHYDIETDVGTNVPIPGIPTSTTGEHYADIDDGKLYIFFAADIKEYIISADGLTLTLNNTYTYPDPPFRRRTCLVKNGYAYYNDSEGNVSAEINTVVRLKLSDLSEIRIQDGIFDGDFNGVFGYTFPYKFKNGDYVYMAGLPHDSEDYLTWRLTILDKPIA